MPSGHAVCVRFIPAGAGNTPESPQSRQPRTVYPRWRGEHWITGRNQRCSAGLSPLARGTLPPAPYQLPLSRFIPAGAGNTANIPFWKAIDTVYPRWRGEHNRMKCAANIAIGLSPLARGTCVSTNTIHSGLRFIPAGAGNTRHVNSPQSPGPVYPRWRGEHAFIERGKAANTGLSPLARGTPITAAMDALRPRFIPAGAGNTLTLCN